MGNSQSNSKNKDIFFCKKCDVDVDTKNQSHCNICHLIIDLETGSESEQKSGQNNKIKHCCACKVQYKDNNHCCKCGLVWEDDNIWHCCICKGKFNLIDTISKYHCCKCKKAYKHEENHCKKCCISYGEFEKHCCKCKKNYNYKDVHCKTCCMTFDISKGHCCKCKELHDIEKEHCEKCCISYSDMEKHCCKCKETYSYDLVHCKNCCLTHERNERHCCKCQEIFDQKDIHCEDCCTTYEYIEKHCCRCEEVYNPLEETHCVSCCHIFNTKKFHCCVCKAEWPRENGIIGCNCDDFKRVLNCFIFEYMTKLNCKQKYILSQCLNKDCNGFTKFNKTIKKLGFSSIYDFLINEKNWIMMFHGTPNIERAMNICCNSWSIDCRTRQLHGEGEYFSTSLVTTKKYAGRNGVIVAALIINPAVCKNSITKIHKDENNHNDMWYVVNNKENEYYCLPVAIIECNIFSPITNYKSCPKKLVRSGARKRLYYQDGNNNFLPYDLESFKIIITNIKKKKYVFNITIKDVTYEINLNEMIQRNINTGNERMIKIDV
jgi:WWE domain